MEGEYISFDGGGGETVSTQASDEESTSALMMGKKESPGHRLVTKETIQYVVINTELPTRRRGQMTDKYIIVYIP